MTRMSDIQYGYVNRSGVSVEGIPSEQEFYNTYKLQSPAELEKSQLGVCWDQVEYERFWFSKTNIQFETYYIELTPGNSHTFLIYEIDNQFYWFEHSWYNHRGINGPFKTKKDIFNRILKFMIQDAKNEQKNKVDIKLAWLCQYNQPKYGIGCQSFMDLMRTYKNITI